VFEEPEDPSTRSFFSEIISSISDVKFSNSGRYMISRDYLSVKVWDLHMETKPIETYTVSCWIRLFDKINLIKFNNRFMNTWEQSYALCMKTIAFSTSSNAAGTVRTRPLWPALTTISSGCLTEIRGKKSLTKHPGILLNQKPYLSPER